MIHRGKHTPGHLMKFSSNLFKKKAHNVVHHFKIMLILSLRNVSIEITIVITP